MLVGVEQAQGKGLSFTLVGFRKGGPEEVTCKLREQVGVEVIRVEMGSRDWRVPEREKNMLGGPGLRDITMIQRN